MYSRDLTSLREVAQLNTMCPVCNGLTGFQALCPSCGQFMQDAGRLYDYYGAYSPYRPIDDAKLTNGIPDLQQHLCIHVGWCDSCQQEARVSIQERRI